MKPQNPRITRTTSQSYPNGKPKKITYFAGKKIATETISRKGKTKLKGDIPDGLVFEYDNEGNLKAEIPFKSNKPNGFIKAYDKGILKNEFYVVDGKVDGLYREYYPNRKIKAELIIQDGQISNASTFKRKECGITKNFAYFEVEDDGIKVSKVKRFLHKLWYRGKCFI